MQVAHKQTSPKQAQSAKPSQLPEKKQDPKLAMRQPKAEKEADELLDIGKVPKQKLPEIDRDMINIKPAPKDQAMVIRRSYAMVVSSYENVVRQGDLDSDAAKQFGKTVDRRINELNLQSRRMVEDLPEYKKLNIEEIQDLGDTLADLIRDEDDYLKAFALLKNPKFASLMESSESVHRSFSEMMRDNGDEQLLFGAIEMVNEMGGLDSIKPQMTLPPSLDIKA